jgi:hypothetical protein
MAPGRFRVAELRFYPQAMRCAQQGRANVRTAGSTDNKDARPGFHDSAAVKADSIPATVRASE